jgi:hypothetical protein
VANATPWEITVRDVMVVHAPDAEAVLVYVGDVRPEYGTHIVLKPFTRGRWEVPVTRESLRCGEIRSCRILIAYGTPWTETRMSTMRLASHDVERLAEAWRGIVRSHEEL